MPPIPPKQPTILDKTVKAIKEFNRRFDKFDEKVNSMLEVITDHRRWRTKTLEAIAETINVTFSPEGDDSFLKILGKYKVFSRSRGAFSSFTDPKTINLMQGNIDDIVVSIFDYQYTDSPVEWKRRTHYQTLLLFQSNQLRIPFFILSPETLIDKLDCIGTNKDIDFNSHKIFSRSFFLQGANEGAIRELFNEKILSYYQSKKGIFIAGSDSELLFFQIGWCVSPKDFKFFMGEGLKALSLFLEASSKVHEGTIPRMGSKLDGLLPKS